MKFRDLIDYFEKLEKTSSRLILIDILAELFTKTSEENIDKIIYLLQGRIAPFYAPIEMGMADKTVASSIADAFSLSKEDVLARYLKIGDMGEAAYEISNTSRFKDEGFEVEEVFDELIKIANTSGEGTVEKRITLLSNLLKKVDSISAKHLVRIPLGNTRLGIGDPTVLDGLALGILKDRSKRKLLEKAYNETSDLGLIGKTLLKEGLNGVGMLGINVGRPIRSELCERLPSPQKVFEKMVSDFREGISENSGVHATPKYDGFRVQIHKKGEEIFMFSRNLEDMSHMFPELIDGAKKQIKAKTAILDTEALAYNPDSEEFLPFQETTKRRRKHNIEEVAKNLPLKAFVFDILYADGKSFIDKPLLERVEEIEKYIDKGDVLLSAPGKVLHTPKDLQMMLDDSISKGLEGVVVKKIDSLYEAGGRNFNWVKLKRHQSGQLNDTIDCVILGYVLGKGKRTAFGAGALLVGVYDKAADEFVTVSKIGTGLSDEEWQSIKKRTENFVVEHKPARVNSLISPSVWVEPRIVIEVLADEITRSPLHTAGAKLLDDESLSNAMRVLEPGYALRFPRLVRFREDDKKPEDATDIDELKRMYLEQSK